VIHFDCHAHVYEHIHHVAEVRYRPTKPAPLADWRALQSRHGLLGGVIVQVSFLGTDNTQLLAALSDLDPSRFAGVAVVDIDCDSIKLAKFVAAGIRGIRWNLVAGSAIPELSSPALHDFCARLREQGLHLEVHLESTRLAPILAALTELPVPVVIDHMGLPVAVEADKEPWINALAVCARRDSIFVKLSAPYRGVLDPRAHLDRLLRLLPSDHFLWGSDWPHTRHETVATYPGLLKELCDRIDDRHAAKTLYGLTGLD
jgi:predicted TIM-barrel fold metal-dependent hydrolase